MYAYVGSRTTRERNARGEGISVFRVGRDGRLALVQRVSDLVNPSFLAINRRGDRLYAVHGDEREVSAFRANREDGSLRLLNRQSCGGSNPVHLALDPGERFLIVSNHLSGTLAVLPLSDDGALEPVSQLVVLSGPIGPHRIEQPFSKPHHNPFDPQGRYVLVPDKGLDRVFSFRFDEGRLVAGAPPCTVAREGAGPRHLAFHPHRPWAYAVNELDSTVTAYRYEAASGGLEAFQVLSTLPDSFTGNSRAAEIAVAPDGRHLYASNRGHDSIALYDLDADTGRMRLAEVVPALGRTPRFFAIAPGGRTFYVLNEDSDSIVAFVADPASGQLSPAGFSIRCGSPVSMVFSA